MYFRNLSDNNLDASIALTKEVSSEILSQLTITDEKVLYSKGTDLSELSRKESKYFILTSGQLELSVSNKTVLIYEEGDLIGLESELPLVCKVQSTDFAIYATPLPIFKIEEQLGHRALMKLQASFTAMLLRAITALLPGEENAEREIRTYSKGEVIIEQGVVEEDIFTMIEGHADVYVDDQKVGEIHPDEVFGALAALTARGRTATIKSSDDSIVLVIKKDQLIELIKMRPGTIEKLIGDLGRVIQDLNKQLANR